MAAASEDDGDERADETGSDAGDGRGDRRYSAPALEKGLDILERLAEERDGLTLGEIAERVGRTKGEIFRMVAVLEARGYLARGEDDRLTATDRLFRVGLARPAYRNLLDVALPQMHAFAEATGFSCHLAVPSDTEMVVVARVESVSHIGFSVRIGYRQPLALTGSGHCLMAFMTGRRLERTLRLIEAEDPGFDRAALLAELDRHRAAGRVRRPSGTAEAVVDLSAPILEGDDVAAALTSPFLRVRLRPMEPDALLAVLKETADRIGAALAV